MSLSSVYLWPNTRVFRNQRFQLVFKLKTTGLKIPAQEHLYAHISSLMKDGLILSLDLLELNPVLGFLNPVFSV